MNEVPFNTIFFITKISKVLKMTRAQSLGLGSTYQKYNLNMSLSEEL